VSDKAVDALDSKRNHTNVVMPGLDPGIHGVVRVTSLRFRAPPAPLRPGQCETSGVDTRVKPGHDMYMRAIVAGSAAAKTLPGIGAA
jgi:hypothetical protein